MLRVGGSYPWRLDEGYTTVLHLKNTIDKLVYALVQVRYAGGSYNLERLPLQPFQTIAVDLRALRDGQQKDIRGGVMPTDSEGGQVVWYEETVGSLIGRAEVRNVAEGVASSFSCNETCPCPPNSSYTYLTPGTSVGPMGGTAQFTAMEQRQNCRGTIFGPYNRTADSTWSSSNTSVFTVSGGMVSCLQPGSGTVTAQFQGTVYGQWCNPIVITQRPGGPVTVELNVKFTQAIYGSQSVSFDLVSRTATLDLDTAVCQTGNFVITVKFELVGSTECCFDDRTYVLLSTDNVFELVNQSFFQDGSATKRKVNITLRRRADGGGSSDRVTVKVFGVNSGGETYDVGGAVRLRCP